MSGGYKSFCIFFLAAATKRCVYSDQDIAKIIRILQKAHTKWFDIGLKLKIHVRRLQAIKEQHGESTLSCFKAVLNEWLKKESDLGLLVEVLKQQETDFTDIIKELQGQCQ